MNMNYKTVITHDLTLRFINISIQYTEKYIHRTYLQLITHSKQLLMKYKKE